MWLVNATYSSKEKDAQHGRVLTANDTHCEINFVIKHFRVFKICTNETLLRIP